MSTNDIPPIADVTNRLCCEQESDEFGLYDAFCKKELLHDGEHEYDRAYWVLKKYNQLKADQLKESNESR